MPPMIEVDDWLASDQACNSEESEQSGERATGRRAGPEPGTVIGGTYRVLQPLGSGSMGIVLLAHDETLDRRVAIKFTSAHLSNAGFRERFLCEARAMARVNHPNVVPVYAFGEHGDMPYFVMEYVPGQTLETWLTDPSAQVDFDRAIHILDDVCRGVEAIHAANTVHHDIKPSNILLDADLRPRVADLGLSVFYRQDLPKTNEIMGTPAYMAPEIAFSKGADPAMRSRADVYSLACVAYELLTGQTPFDGVGNMGMLLQHAMREAAPPSQLRPYLPPAIDQAVLHALAKDPAERTPTAEAFRRDLITAHRQRGDPRRILVAEDDDDSREALGLMLGMEFPKADVECVRDGLAALEAFDREPPSVMIIDLRMPQIDGIELTRLVRARPMSSAMPIIVLTACGGPDEWRRLAALGADRLLVKPVILDDVIALVRRAMTERSGGGLQILA